MNPINRIVLLGACLLSPLLGSPATAQVPPIINYQGRVAVGTTNFDGTGQFRFAIVDAAGTTTLWSNDGTSVNGSQPTNAVSLPVAKGLYSVLLGDATVTNMTAVPATVFANSDVRLRVWFNDGATGSQLLSPDQRLASVGYAMTASTVPDGAITTAKIALGAVNSEQIATGAVGYSEINSNTVQRRIQGSAPAGSYVTGVNSDGSVTSAVAAPFIWQLNSNEGAYYLGNVGVGTSTPTYKLHIADINGLGLRLDSPTPTIAFVDTSASNALTFLRGVAGGLRVLNNTSAPIMELKSTGRLGLGTTAPLSALHVSGTADALRLSGTKPFLTFDDSGTFSRIQSNGPGLDFKTNGAVLNNSPGIIHLDGTGTVGLGTTTPLHQLSIRYFPGAPLWTSDGWIGAIDMDNSAAIAWGANSGGQRFGMGHTNGAFNMFRTAANPGSQSAAATYDFTITDTGNVGIGTTAPQFPLDVNGSMHVGSYLASGTPKLIRFGDINGINGYVSIGENNVDDQMELTAGRFVFNNGSVGIGTTTPAARLHASSGGIQAQLTQTTAGDYARLRFNVTGSPYWDIAAGSASNVMNFYASGTGKNVLSLNPNGTVSVAVLTITGGSDLAEPFPIGDEKVEKGSVVVIDETHPGHLKRSTRAYDHRVAGIVSGANGVQPGIALHQEGVLEGGDNVALSGRVYVKANTSAGRIEAGDLLTTSDIPGEAMKASDHDRAQGAILGKAMGDLSDSSGHVLVLVTLQ